MFVVNEKRAIFLLALLLVVSFSVFSADPSARGVYAQMIDVYGDPIEGVTISWNVNGDERVYCPAESRNTFSWGSYNYMSYDGGEDGVLAARGDNVTFRLIKRGYKRITVDVTVSSYSDPIYIKVEMEEEED